MTINTFQPSEYSFLSNFYPSKVLRPTLEHHYQAAKAIKEEDRELILNAKTPARAKKLGRQVAMRPDWDETKIETMKTLLLLKFADVELFNRLKATGDAMLIEGNYWHDNFWGDCWCQKCSTIEGQNWLGKLLMEIRDIS